MYAFIKSIKKANQIRRYTIQTATSGWEVREEQGSEIVRQVHYQDWHRVERARRELMMEMHFLQENGWTEEREAEI